MAPRDQQDQALPKGYTRRRCSYCNLVQPCRFRENPFRFEMEGDKTRFWLCDKCVDILYEEV
jgi:hypothetical protein